MELGGHGRASLRQDEYMEGVRIEGGLVVDQAMDSTSELDIDLGATSGPAWGQQKASQPPLAYSAGVQRASLGGFNFLGLPLLTRSNLLGGNVPNIFEFQDLATAIISSAAANKCIFGMNINIRPSRTSAGARTSASAP